VGESLGAENVMAR